MLIKTQFIFFSPPHATDARLHARLAFRAVDVEWTVLSRGGWEGPCPREAGVKRKWGGEGALISFNCCTFIGAKRGPDMLGHLSSSAIGHKGERRSLAVCSPPAAISCGEADRVTVNLACLGKRKKDASVNGEIFCWHLETQTTISHKKKINRISA